MPCENYVISLQKVYDNKPRTRRANHAITVVYDFFKKHARKDKKDIIISSEVNECIWARSIQKPPRKVEVSIKTDNGKIYVFLKDSKAFKEFGKVLPQEKKGKAKPKAEEVKEEAVEVKPKTESVKPKTEVETKPEVKTAEIKPKKEEVKAETVAREPSVTGSEKPKKE